MLKNLCCEFTAKLTFCSRVTDLEERCCVGTKSMFILIRVLARIQHVVKKSVQEK